MSEKEQRQKLIDDGFIKISDHCYEKGKVIMGVFDNYDGTFSTEKC